MKVDSLLHEQHIYTGEVLLCLVTLGFCFFVVAAAVTGSHVVTRH